MARQVHFTSDKSNFGQNFLQDFDLLGVLGKGAFSVVKKCRGKHLEVAGKEFAVKIIRANQLTSKNKLKLDKEERICKTLKHPNIVSLHYSYKDETNCYLVFDLVLGGELFDDIVKREHYSETDASKCLRQILLAVQFCHDRNIIHRDIKPENLLLSSKVPPVDIKLADFGLAVELETAELAWYGFAGTPGYLSPEVLKKGPYGKPIDLWACGIILYILLVGYPPFWHEDQQKLYTLIRRGELEFPSPEWDSVTNEAKELVQLLLQVDQQKRLTSKEALKHSWVYIPETASKFHRQKTIEVLKSFNAKGKFKAAVFSTILSNQLIRGLASQKESLNRVSEAPQLTNDLVLTLTQKLVDAIAGKDWKTYSVLCDEQLTCFEPETNYNLIQGLKFHKFYFDNPTPKIVSFKNTITNPRVNLLQKTGAVIGFVRNTEFVLENGETVNFSVNETRIWSKIGQFWKCIHFHRS